MGISILELVLQQLREAAFTADVAFPGQKYPTITEPVAAVHIEKVDRANLAVTVEVSVICPASLGGSRCEVEALRATEILRQAGATCIQNGCNYDGVAQAYVVSVMATFVCVTDEESCTLGPGFTVYLEETEMPFTVSFRAEQKLHNEALYEMGESAPIGISQGSWAWEIRLEELIPAGNRETEQMNAVFDLYLENDFVRETFYQCRWTGIQREFTREGLRRVRTGIAMRREVK